MIMIELAYFLCGALAAIFWCVLLSKTNETIQLGGFKANKNTKDIVFSINKVENTFVTDEDYDEIVRYTASTGFYTKHIAKHFKMLRVEFYGKAGQYNVGDEVTFTRVSK